MFLFTHPHALLLTSTAHPGLFLHALSIDTSADKLRLTLLQVHSITPTIPPDEQMNTHTSTQCIVSANEAAVYHTATVTLTRSSSCFTFFFSFFFILYLLCLLHPSSCENTRTQKKNSDDIVLMFHRHTAQWERLTDTQRVFSAVTPELTPSLSQSFLFVCFSVSVQLLLYVTTCIM